jgi:hypothetical protein
MVKLQLAFSSNGQMARFYRRDVDDMTEAVNIMFDGEHQEQRSIDDFVLAAAHCGIDSLCQLDSDEQLAEQHRTFLFPMGEQPVLTLTADRRREPDDVLAQCHAKLVRSTVHSSVYDLATCRRRAWFASDTERALPYS